MKISRFSEAQIIGIFEEHHVWTPLRCKRFLAAMRTGRVHPCVRPVRAARYGCWP